MRASVSDKTNDVPEILRHASHGFTLTELLVVIALMVFLMILAWPALGMFTSSTRLEGAVNGVSVAAQVMRVLNGQSRPHLDSPAHNGTAMVLLVNSSGVVEIHWTMNTGLTTGTNPKNIYNDLDPQRAPVKLPNGMSVAGIAQPGASKLLDSPFAVRFNQYGQVMPGLITSVASDSNPILVRYQNTTDMSCVLGLVVYVKDQAVTANLLDTAGAIKPTTTIDDLRLKAQGRVIFFNRYSGAASIEGVR